MGKVTLGYWDIRGLAEPIRYLLHFKGIQFEDKRYTYDDVDAWMKKDKLSLPLDFPNLPYYIDDEVRLTQSNAILRYLAEKLNLGGHTKEERLRVYLAEQQIFDFRASAFRVLHSPEFEKILPEFLEKIPVQLKYVEAFLGDRKHLVGDRITYVDFMAYDTIDMYRYVAPKVLNEFPRLKAYQQRMENLPELQEYFHSPTYKRWPFLGPLAAFGCKGPEPTRE